jgi:hypothetical protein
MVTSVASSNLVLVTGPGPDHRSGGEVALGRGAGIAPARVSGDGVALLFVGAVVGAVEREVAQGGELRLDPVQPGGVDRPAKLEGFAADMNYSTGIP